MLNTSEYFCVNSWYTTFTRFHPLVPGSLVLFLLSNNSLGSFITSNPTLGTLSPRNVTFILKYHVMGMSPPFAPLRLNKFCEMASGPLAGPSFGFIFLCWTRLTILPESYSDAIFLPIHSKLTWVFCHYPLYYYKFHLQYFCLHFPTQVQVWCWALGLCPTYWTPIQGCFTFNNCSTVLLSVASCSFLSYNEAYYNSQANSQYP